MDDIKVKKEIIDKIKSSSNILITVSNDPSVDELSAALGLTLALNKIEKYATAIFSGGVPPAISFLEPEKTFENNTDSLRDFIIALNREKADHLRFKPDGDYVKIFITPYRSIITPEDLEFSQGDFNVELVITLGVDSKEHLDDALDNHGQILHDATVVSVTSGEAASSIGSLNWHNPKASSISEMVTGLLEALKEDKKEAIIDGPIATALLTGIVAETERFSNSHTTSRVMTVASSLMSAGADQQLIAFKLEQSGDLEAEAPSSEGSAEKDDDESAYTLSIDRDTKAATLVPAEETLPDNSVATSSYGLDEPEEAKPEPAPVEDTEKQEEPEQPAPVAADIPQSPAITGVSSPSRGYVAGPGPGSPYGPDATEAATSFPGAPAVAPGSMSVSEMPPVERLHSAYATEDDAAPQQEEQPAATEPVPSPEPSPVSAPPAPADLGLPMPPPLPDAPVVVAPAPALPVPETPQPEILGDILQPEPAQPVVPVEPPASEQPAAPLQPPQPEALQPSGPGQFQIPTPTQQ